MINREYFSKGEGAKSRKDMFMLAASLAEEGVEMIMLAMEVRASAAPLFSQQMG